MAKDPEKQGVTAKAFWILFALAGLGLGMWLFGRRRGGGATRTPDPRT